MVSVVIELNYKICYKLSSQDLPDGIEMALIGPVLQRKLNQKCAISLMNLTYLYESLASMTSSSLSQQLMLENLNPTRNHNLGWLHACEPRSAREITSVKRSVKIARSGLMLVKKLPRLSLRSRQKVRKIFSKTQCPTPTIHTCGKSFKVSMVLLMLTLLMKQRPTIVVPSLISNLKLASS